MSVVSIINTGDAVHLLTDGGLFNRGVVEHITNKARAFPHLNAAFAFRSSIGWWTFLIERVGYDFSSFDGVVDGIAEFFQGTIRAITAGHELHGEELWFCGWSDQRQRFETYGISSHGLKQHVHGVASEPWALTRIDGDVIVPIDPTFYQRLATRPTDAIEELGIAIAECQRQMIWENAHGDDEILVGAHIQLTTVTKDMISQKILKTWPDKGVKVSFFDTSAVSGLSADSGSGGTKGLVPAPAAGDAAAGKFLKADGTWSAPSALRYDTAQSLSSGEKQQAQENLGATAAGRSLLTAASSSAQRAALNAPPLPQTASGAGQVVNLAPGAAAAVVLPAGGTWFWGVFSFATSGTNIAQGWSSGVDAGGTTVRAASGTQTHTGFAWRIA